MSKATVLQKSIDYIQFLQQQKKKQEEERNSLRKEVLALKIMQQNYELIVKAQQSEPSHTDMAVSDELKFSVVSTRPIINVTIDFVILFTLKQSVLPFVNY